MIAIGIVAAGAVTADPDPADVMRWAAATAATAPGADEDAGTGVRDGALTAAAAAGAGAVCESKSEAGEAVRVAGTLVFHHCSKSRCNSLRDFSKRCCRCSISAARCTQDQYEQSQVMIITIGIHCLVTAFRMHQYHMQREN